MEKIKHPVRITTLVENTACAAGLGTEHGLSYWIEYGDVRILFDTGQSDLFVRNAQALGVDLTTAHAIVLSHGHYDHTGGLATALRLAHRPRVFMHPAAFQRKYTRHDDGNVHEITMPRLTEADIRAAADELIWTDTPTPVAEGIFVTGRVPRAHNFEDTGGAFYLDSACTQPDPLEDDQAIFFRCSRGLVVLLGCAHAGVINTIRHIQAVTGGWSVCAVIGGMHLKSASPRRLDATIQAFREQKLRLIAPNHCTGTAAMQMIQEQLPDCWAECAAGAQFVFE